MDQGFGLVSSGDDLPNPSTVVRYVGYARMARDEDENILGPLPSAFAERPHDDYLSVTWSEYFEGTPGSRIRCAIEAIRASNIDVKPKACFCIADTRELLMVIDEHGPVGRAVFLPEDDNPAHAGIYGVSPDEAQLLETLAASTWGSFLTKEMADQLPLTVCAKSPEVD